MREMKDSGIEWIGEIPKEWETTKMKYIGKYINGYAFKPSDWTSKGKPIIRIQDLTGSNDNPNYYEGEIDSKYSITKGDILVSWAATLDAYIWNKNDGLLNQHIFKAIPNEIVEKSFFFWLIKEAMTNMNNDNKHGIVMQHVTLDVFNNFGIPLPPLEEQQKISAYLNDKCTKIDSIIEKQEKVIEKLKAYKLSVLTEAVTKGLNPDVKMKESGVQWIGEIPEHWEQTALKVGLADIQTGPFGSQLHAEDYIENGIYVINPANIINGKIVIDSKCSISYEKANELAQHLLSVGDIVFARRGEMGRCACALDDGIQKLCGTGCIKLKCNDRLIPKYIILYLQTHYIKQYLELNSVGTTMLNLNSTIISNIPILIPPISEQQQIVNYLDKKCSAIDKSIEQKQAIIEKLKEYKKSLIYEVVTGKREV